MTRFNRLGGAAVALILTAGTAFLGIVMPASTFNTYAENAESLTTVNAFDSSDVDRDIDTSKYPVNPNGSVQLIEFAEYGFSESLLNCGNYGIYLYVYNPAKIEISERAGANTVNMAVIYDENGEPDGYRNIPVSLCGVSGTGTVYKFKVQDEGNAILKNARSFEAEIGRRRYDVAGVQLWTKGEANATDYKVAYTYYYSGYAAGYGGNEESTLNCRREEIETLQLKVYPTFYRPEGDNGKNLTQDTLYSVFFSVPNEYIEKYGDLSKIHATWLEAATKYMYLTGNEAVYNAFKEYIGKSVSENCQYSFLGDVTESWTTNDSVTNYFYDGKIGYNFSSCLDYGEVLGVPVPTVSYQYNLVGNALDALYWLFGTEDFSVNSADGYILSAEEILDYARSYSKGKTNLIDGTIYSKDLFESWADEKTEVNYSREETFTLNSYEYSETFWSLLLNSKALRESTNNRITVNRIQAVEKCENAAQVAQDYCIDENDFKQLKGIISEDETVYVFHFAVSDYYATECYEFDNTGAMGGDKLDTNARLFQETAYLGFDVIDVTFEKGEEVTVIGVVANPIDVIGDGTPALNFNTDPIPSWLPYALLIIAVLTAAFVTVKIVKSNTGEKK